MALMEYSAMASLLLKRCRNIKQAQRDRATDLIAELVSLDVQILECENDHALSHDDNSCMNLRIRILVAEQYLYSEEWRSTIYRKY